MNILVCIKPDILGQELGPFEAIALEAGLRMRESLEQAGKKNIGLDVVTAGPPQWEDTLRRAFGMGADKGFHILTRPGLVPAGETAALLAGVLSHPKVSEKYDLILTGVMSQDLMAGQTGPMMAEYLDFALATAVVEIAPGKKGIIASREWEGGVREVLEIPLPALVSIQAGEYTPRYPSLSNMLRAKSKSVLTMNPGELVRDDLEPAVPELFLDMSLPEKTRAGKRVHGPLSDQVRALKAFLKERALI